MVRTMCNKNKHFVVAVVGRVSVSKYFINVFISKFSTRSNIFYYSNADTKLKTIKIITKEVVNVSTDYRTPFERN